MAVLEVGLSLGAGPVLADRLELEVGLELVEADVGLVAVGLCVTLGLCVVLGLCVALGLDDVVRLGVLGCPLWLGDGCSVRRGAGGAWKRS